MKSRLPIRSFIAEGRFARSVAVLAGGTAAGQLVVLAGAPFLTRLYTPVDLGLFGLFSVFVGSASGVMSLRYDAAVVSAQDVDDARSVAWLALILVIPTALFASGILVLLTFLDLLGYGDLPVLAFPLAFAAMVLSSLVSVGRHWMLREETFGLISRVTFAQNTARTVGQVALGWSGLGFVGLATGDVIGRSTGLITALRSLWAGVSSQLPEKDDLRRVAASFREFPQYSAPSTLIDAAAASLPIPLLAALFGVGTAGQFFLVQRVLSVPSALIGRSVGDAFHGRFARGIRAGAANGRDLFVRTSIGLLVLGVGPALLLLFAGEALFPFLFGDSWELAGVMAGIAAPWFLAGFVVAPVSRIVLVVGGQRAKLVYDIIALAGVVATFVWARAADTSVENTLILLSATQVFGYLIYFWFLWGMSSRRPG